MKMMNDLRKRLENLQCDGIASGKRDFVMYTGMEGMDQFNYALEQQNAIDKAEWLLETKRITVEKKENLVKMINSSDRENFNLAVLLIEQFTKSNQDVTKIYSRKSQV